MSQLARAACVVLALMVLLGGCGGKSRSTAYPIPPPAPPGQDKPVDEVSRNLELALGSASGQSEILEEKRDSLPSDLVSDKGNAAYSGERLTGSVTARTAAMPAPNTRSVPPAPKAPPAMPRVPVEQQAASAVPPVPAAPSAPPQAAPTKTEAPPPAPPAPTANLAGGGRVMAQLASFRTRANAEGGWQRLRAAHPEQLGDRALILQETDIGDRGVYYRVRTGPFADNTAAKAFCARLQARDQACLVISPQ